MSNGSLFNLSPRTELESLYRILAQNLPDTAIFLLDADLRILVAEGQALKHSAYNSQSLENRYIAEILGENSQLLVQYRQTRAMGEDIMREYEFSQGVYTVRSFPIWNNQHQIDYIMIVTQNITRQVEAQKALTESEKRHRTLLDALPDVMFVLNREGIITAYHSQDEEEVFFPKNAVGKSLIETTLPFEIVRKTIQAVETTLTTGKTQNFDYEVKFQEQSHYFEARTLAVDENEALTLVRDVTDRRRTQLDLARRNQELQLLYERVQKLEQLKTDMIRIASHDLKNPLAGVMGYLEMLKWEVTPNLSEMHQGYLEQIEKATQRMHRIATGILSLERIEQMADNQTTERCELNALLEATYQELLPIALAKHQEITITPCQTRFMVLGDLYQLYEAIKNLVMNAIKYTPEHGHITLELTGDGRYVDLRVIDDGYGIPAHLRDRLFSPFYRAKTRETAHIDGTGLGLHLVKNIVERHNGIMLFESVYQQGSMFGFRLECLP
jgi:signal transduction histidine kinase